MSMNQYYLYFVAAQAEKYWIFYSVVAFDRRTAEHRLIVCQF